MLSQTLRRERVAPAGARSLAATLVGASLCILAGPAAAQDADAVAQYSALLQQIADVNTSIAQQEFYVAQQEAEIARLQQALATANAEGGQPELLPMLRNMVGELEEVMVEDLPIRVERRFALLDDLREDISSDDASAYDGFRRAMDLIGDEVELGLSVGSYSGNNPVNPGQRFAACQADPNSARCDLSKDQQASLTRGATVEDFNQLSQLPDGNYIHYGRMALLYLERDSSEGYRYDANSKSWQPVRANELLSLRQNVRIARGESAIATMTFPMEIGGVGGDDAS